ncbi:MAG: pyridoxal phosphate-dependent aminotransferase, partial [Planctomycetota bacterium]
AGSNKYSQTTGDTELLEKIESKINEEFGWQNASLIVTGGASGGLLLAFMALVNPCDEVIIPDPYFVMYKHLVNMLGGKCVFVDSYPDFKLPVEKIEKAITPKTKIIVLNSPCNPSGAVYSKEHIKSIAEVAGKNNMVVISDEVYEKFSYEGSCSSIASYHDKTLLLRGFSKAYAMTGWRLGFIATQEPLKAVVNEMAKIQQYTFVCAPTPFQKAAIAALDYDVSDLVESYRRKRDILYEGLKDNFQFVRPGGAFYAFIKAPNGSGTDFVAKAIKNNLLIIPGNVFSEMDTHFRVSYATTDDNIRRGIDILKSLV